MLVPTWVPRRWAWRAFCSGVVLVVASIGGTLLVWRMVETSNDDRARDQCAIQAKAQSTMRAVIREATSPQTSIIHLPTDPNVDPAVIAYLQRLVDASVTENTTQTRHRLLAAAPPIFCAADGTPIIGRKR